MSTYKIYKSRDDSKQCWRWRLQDNNHEIIAQTEEPFLKENIEDSIRKIQENAPDAPVLNADSSSPDGYYFEYYADRADEWRWRLKAGNHEIMAVGESYTSLSGVKIALDNIKVEMGRATIVWED